MSRILRFAVMLGFVSLCTALHWAGIAAWREDPHFGSREEQLPRSACPQLAALLPHLPSDRDRHDDHGRALLLCSSPVTLHPNTLHSVPVLPSTCVWADSDEMLLLVVSHPDSRVARHVS